MPGVRIFSILLICAALIHCYGGGPSAGERRITVAAAADLSFALKEAAMEFEKETGIKTDLSFGSTGMLAKQIENGAPFDLFFAADVKTMELLANGGWIAPDTLTQYAVGGLAIVVSKASAVKVATLKDLTKPDVRWISIAQPLHAPYGKASLEALKNAGLWDRVKHKVVYAENIRQALQYVQTGDATAGIVALSIADAPQVEYAAVPPSLHNPVKQAAGVVATSGNKAGAEAFLKYMTGSKGTKILKKYRFAVP